MWFAIGVVSYLLGSLLAKLVSGVIQQMPIDYRYRVSRDGTWWGLPVLLLKGVGVVSILYSVLSALWKYLP